MKWLISIYSTLTVLLLEWGCLSEWGSLLNRGTYSNYPKTFEGGCLIIRKGSLIGRRVLNQIIVIILYAEADILIKGSV